MRRSVTAATLAAALLLIGGPTATAPESTFGPGQVDTTAASSGGGDMTGGSGGALTDRTFQTYTSGGLTSQYHIYAGGLDWTRHVGILIYMDGSGGYGFDNPSSSYLLGGADGLVNVARRNNMLLIVPEAPPPGCPSDNCWYDRNGVAKATWAANLVTSVQGQYDLDKSRGVIAGYSSGAQGTASFLGPAHGASLISDGVMIPISYGSRPRRATPSFTDAFKRDVVVSWDVGSADTSALNAARGGEAWYRSQGFTTQLNVVQGEGHSRSGQFGAVVEREIREHVRPS